MSSWSSLEALVDRAPVAQHLDVVQGVGHALALLEGRCQLGDHRLRPALELVERLAVVRDEPLDRAVGRRGDVLDDLPRPRRAEPALDQARQDVVDALSRNAGDPCHLGRRGRAAANQREVRLRLVHRQAELGSAARRVGQAVPRPHRRVPPGRVSKDVRYRPRDVPEPTGALPPRPGLTRALRSRACRRAAARTAGRRPRRCHGRGAARCTPSWPPRAAAAPPVASSRSVRSSPCSRPSRKSARMRSS